MKVMKVLEKLPATLDQAVAVMGVEAPVLRKMVVSCVSRAGTAEGLPQTLADRLAPLCKVIGMDDYADEMARIFVDREQPFAVRETALAVLFHTAEGQRVFNDLPPRERVDFCGPWVRPMLVMGSSDQQFPRFALAALYAATPADTRTHLCDKIVELIHQLGTAVTADAVSVLIKALTPEQRARVTHALAAEEGMPC